MQKRTGWILLGAVFVGPVIGFLMACVVTYVMPKKYESEAIIEVKPVDSSAAISPQFLATQFEIIKNRDSLGKVVDSLDLVKKWTVDKETAIRILKGIVDTQNIRGTDLISIRIKHTDKEDARDITAEVARAYKDYRMGMVEADEESRLAELNKVVREQESKVEERRKALSKIETARKKNIVVDGKETLLHLPESRDYTDAARDLGTDEELLQQMKLKQTEAIVRSRMTAETVVVHDDPQIADFPISPNVTLNLIIGAPSGSSYLH